MNVGTNKAASRYLWEVVNKLASVDSYTRKIIQPKSPVSKYAHGLTNMVPMIQRLEIVYEPLSHSGGWNSLGIVEYILSGKLIELARKRPYLEIAVVRKASTPPRVVGYYASRTASVILLNKLKSEEIEKRILFLCNSSDGAYKKIDSKARTIRPEGLEDNSSLRAWDPISARYPWKP